MTLLCRKDLQRLVDVAREEKQVRRSSSCRRPFSLSRNSMNERFKTDDTSIEGFKDFV